MVIRIAKQVAKGFVRRIASFAKATILLKTTFFVVFVGFLLNIVFDSRYTHRFVEEMINSALQENSLINVRFNKLDLSVFPLKAELFHLEIADSATGNNLVVVNHLAAELSFVSLLLGQFRFSQVKCDEMLVYHTELMELAFSERFRTLRQAMEGDDHLAKLGITGLEDGLSQDYAFSMENMVQRLVIRHGRFDQKEWSVSGYQLAARGFELDVDFDGFERGSGFVEVDGIRVQDSTYSYLDGGAVELALSWEGGKLRLRDVDLQAQDMYFRGSLVRDFQSDDPSDHWDIQGQFSLPLSFFGMFLQASHQSGYVAGDVAGGVYALTSSDPSIDLRGSVKIEDGMLGGFQLLDSSFDYTLSDKKIEFLDLVIADNNLDAPLARGKGSILFDFPYSYDFSLVPTSLSLSHIFQITKVYGDIVDAQIVGDAFRIYGIMNPFELYAVGDNTFEQLHVPTLSKASAPASPEESPKKSPEESPEETYSSATAAKPDCRMTFDLAFDSHMMDFRDSGGSCVFFGSDYEDALSLQGKVEFSGKTEIIVGLQAKSLIAYETFMNFPLQGEDAHIELSIMDDVDKSLELSLSGKAQSVSLWDMPFGNTQAHLVLDVDAQKLFLQKLLVTPQADSSQNHKHQGSKEGKTAEEVEKQERKNAQSKKAPASSIELTKGWYDFQKETLSFSLKGTQLSKAYVQRLLPAEVSLVSADELNFDVQTTWNIRRPLALSLKGTMSGKELHHNEELLARSFAIDVAMEEGRVHLRNSTFYLSEAFPLSISGWMKAPTGSLGDLMDPKTTMDIALHSGTSVASTVQLKSPHLWLDFANLPYLRHYLQSIALAGHVNTKGKITGALRAPDAKVVVYAKDLESSTLPMDMNAFRGEWDMRAGVASYIASFEGMDLSLSGEMDVTAKSYSMLFKGKDLNVLPYVALGLPEHFSPKILHERGYRMLVDGKLALSGYIHKDINGELFLDRLDAILAKPRSSVPSSSPSPWVISLEEATFVKWNAKTLQAAKPFRFSNQWTQLSFVLQESSSLKDVSFRLLGSLDSRLLRVMAPKFTQASGSIALSGFLSAKVHEGLRYKLQMQASEQKPLTLGYKGLYPLLRGVSFQADINEKGLHLAKLRARKGQGIIKASGSIPWSKEDRATGGIDISMSEGLFRLDSEFFGPVVAVIDADLKLQRYPWLLSGDISVAEARSRRSMNILEDLLMVNVTRFDQGFMVSSRDVLSLDLNIIAEESLKMDNYPVSLVAGGELQVKGNMSQQIISGYMDISRGKVFYKREYEITEGSLLFEHAVDFDPFLEVRAQTRVDDYLVIVDMRGYLSNPTLEFYADPPTRESGEMLSRFDILYMMANGRLPEGDLSWGMQQEVLLSEGLNIAFNMVNQRIAEVITLDEDSFIQDFSLSSFTSERTGETRVRAEAPVNTGQEDLDVILRSDVEALGLRAEYELDDNVATSFNYFRLIDPESLNTSRVSNAPPDKVDASLGLRFRFSFP